MKVIVCISKLNKDLENRENCHIFTPKVSVNKLNC